MTVVHDLGWFGEPLLVFGGPYGNLQATQALLAEAKRLDIPPRRMLCTGDLVAYCGDPRATVELIRDAGIPVVMGNCEESLGQASQDCGCGYQAGSMCELLSVQWYGYASRVLDDATKAWMRGLPHHIAFRMAGRRLLAVHGGVSSINRMVFPATPPDEKAAELALSGADGVVAGHSGVPFSQLADGRLWHNAGAIGLPANDATPRVWYSILRPCPDGVLVEHRPLAYDHAAAARSLREAGLPDAYAETLETGIWPSDDIMPEADRGARGAPLAPNPLLWQQ